MAPELNSVVESSCSSSFSKWWKGLWALKIPSKVKIFIWRLFCRSLGLNTKLISKQVEVEAVCGLYRNGEENISHCFFFYEQLQAVLFWLNWWDLIQNLRLATILDILVGLFSYRNKPKFELCSITLWLIWHRCNTFLFEKEYKCSFELVGGVIVSFLSDFRISNLRLSSLAASPVVGISLYWIPPPSRLL